MNENHSSSDPAKDIGGTEKTNPFSHIIRSLLGINLPEVKEEKDLATNMDDNLTAEQKKRDVSTTDLYIAFIDNYKSNKLFSRKYKVVICRWCLWIIAILTASIVATILIVVCSTERKVGDIVTMVTAVASLIGTIIGILTIVAKHLFPENEEKHMTEIVKLIHENDFKNKEVNINHSHYVNGHTNKEE